MCYPFNSIFIFIKHYKSCSIKKNPDFLIFSLKKSPLKYLTSENRIQKCKS